MNLPWDFSVRYVFTPAALVYAILLSSGALLRSQGAPVASRLMGYRVYRWVLVVCTVGTGVLHLWMVNQPLGHDGSPWDPRAPVHLLMVFFNFLFFVKTLLSWTANSYHPLFLETYIDARLVLQRGVYAFSDQYLILLRLHYTDFAMILSKSVGCICPAYKSKALTALRILFGLVVVSGMLQSFEEEMVKRPLGTEGWQRPYTDYLWCILTLGCYPLIAPVSPEGCLTLVFGRVLVIGAVLRQVGWASSRSSRSSRSSCRGGISRLPGDPGVAIDG